MKHVFVNAGIQTDASSLSVLELASPSSATEAIQKAAMGMVWILGDFFGEMM